MRHSLEPTRGNQWPAWPWFGTRLILLLVVTAALVFVKLSVNPAALSLQGLALYLVLCAIATMSVGWYALRLAERAVGLTIRAKVFLGASISGGVTLLNIFLVAERLSTAPNTRSLLALLAFDAGVMLFFSMWVAAMVATHIEVVGTGISALTAGQYQTRVPVEGGDEVADLAGQVNDLAQQLEMTDAQRTLLEQERRELTAAISHDLRTPLASVRAMVEALSDHVVQEPVEVERYYRIMQREILRLSRMIDDLFELAQLDVGMLQLDRHPLILEAIVAEVVAGMQAQAERSGVTLQLDMALVPVRLPLDGARIERVVANLLRNALEHTPAGGQIVVGTRRVDPWVELHVTDSGEGIEPADLTRIWDRFYRVERSRQRQPESVDGVGLGLAIVRGIVEAHGGVVAVQSSPTSGTVFTIRLPLH